VFQDVHRLNRRKAREARDQNDGKDRREEERGRARTGQEGGGPTPLTLIARAPGARMDCQGVRLDPSRPRRGSAVREGEREPAC
jgi:hypothetical protein